MSEENIVMSIAEIENNTNSEVFGLSSPIEEEPVVIEPTPEPEPVVIEPTPEPEPEPVIEPTSEPEPVIMRPRIEVSSGKMCDQEDYSTGFTFEDSDTNYYRDEHEDSDMSFQDFDIPELIFIVPYRDREEHYKIFASHMKNILEGKKYKIYYVHQCDNQEFNRGAMKNIGFLIVKQLYPDFYKDITLIFNDIDTMPYTKDLFEYNTKIGNVKHFYGFTYTLGGIVSIKASDFEKINGFPNFWSWGYEDNILLQRVNNENLIVDRSQFYEKGDNNILQLNDGLFRNINRGEFDFFMRQTTEGIHSIYDLEYKIDEITGFINVNKFNTDRKENKDTRSMHDLRKGNVPFLHALVPKKKSKRMGMFML